MLAVTSFALAGAIQKEQPKKATAKKTTTAKKSPTPSKKSNTTAKKSPTPSKKGKTTAKKETEKKAASTTKKGPSGQKASSTTGNPNTKTAAAKNKENPKSTTKAKPNSTTRKKGDKGDLEKALAIEEPGQKTKALTKFLADYPKSSLRPRALESLTVARVASGDAKLEAGDRDDGLRLIRLAIQEAPMPYPEKLFVEIISKVPSGLYLRGEQSAALEAAATIEKNSASSVPQLLSLANFWLSTENGDQAKRLAETAIKVDERSAAAYQTLGVANRLNFDLEASSSAFTKALEIDPESVAARRSLADMKRALGRSDEALSLYAEVLTKDPDDLPAQTGRILSLFESGKRSDAEVELSRLIEANGANVILLAGASWWYASNGENAKAIDLAGKAIAAEPRYIWSHIALARAYSSEGRMADAEQTLLRSKKYGNFATLEFELAAVRFSSGFYREAAQELQKSFSVKDGMVSTKLGRRIERSEKSFPELLAYERRASILLPKSADNADDAERMKTLLEFISVLAESKPDPARAAELADAFVKGSDRMRYHRQIYAANALLEKRIAPAKALELSRLAISGVDDGLSISSPAAPIMASELYAGRNAAMAVDRYVVVPEVPKQTLSAVARGRIEEIAGWSLIEQGSAAEAIVRLRRAVSILPEKSAWWRSSMWRLGTALEADGKEKDALDAYVKAYASSEPDAAKYAAIAAIFTRVNGGTEGLETLIGANPTKTAEKVTEAPPTKSVETAKETNTARIEEKPIAKAEVPGNVTTGDDKTTDPKKLPEPVTEIPTSVPVETNKKSDPASVEEKPIGKTDAALPVSKIEEKQTEPKGPPERVTETPTRAPAETPKIEEKQSELKALPEKVTETPTPASVETSKKTDSRPADEKPVARDNVPPPVTKVDDKAEVSTKPVEKETERSLFEPVVIEVKRSTNPAKTTDKSRDSDEKVAHRTRVVGNREVVGKAPPPCTVTISEENISLIADGGSIGVLVGVDGEADLKLLAAATSSPKDLGISREPEIAGVTNRAYFVIKSLANVAGDYKIVFAAPCGKKEINVRVR